MENSNNNLSEIPIESDEYIENQKTFNEFNKDLNHKNISYKSIKEICDNLIYLFENRGNFGGNVCWFLDEPNKNKDNFKCISLVIKKELGMEFFCPKEEKTIYLYIEKITQMILQNKLFCKANKNKNKPITEKKDETKIECNEEALKVKLS